MDAKQTYDKLVSLGHEYNPAKQTFKASIAHLNVTLYHPTSVDDDGRPAPTPVRASDVESFIRRGFMFERPETAAKRKTRAK